MIRGVRAAVGRQGPKTELGGKERREVYASTPEHQAGALITLYCAEQAECRICLRQRTSVQHIENGADGIGYNHVLVEHINLGQRT